MKNKTKVNLNSLKSVNKNLFLTVLISTLFLSSYNQTFQVKASPYDNIISVNNEFISEREFNEAFVMKKKYEYELKKEMSSSNDSNKKILNEIRKHVVDELILNKIVLQYAEKENITVTDDMVKEELKSIKIDNFNKDESKFKKALEKNEINEEELNSLLRKKLIMTKFMEKLFAKNISITEKELKEAYETQKKQFFIQEEVEASHILLKDKKTANLIYKKLKKGANFEVLVKKYSLDPSAKNNDGKLGYFHKGDMVAEFEKAAFSMKVGELSKPIKTTYGFHIIKVTGYKPAKTLSFKEVSSKLEDEIKTKKQIAFIKEWKEKALKEADIKYYNFEVIEK